MGKKLLITGGIFVLAILVFGGFIIIQKNKKVDFSPDNLEDCKALTYNGNDRVNLLFFSTEQDAMKYTDNLFSYEPLNADDFNVFYIDDYFPECELYKGEALLCYSKKLIRKFSSCPSDYIVVVQEHDAGVRSSAYMNVMSLNANHEVSVFAHEVGHAFMALTEEYVPAKIIEGSPNCFATCDPLDSESCFQGCSDSNYYRSVENGIMRTLDSSSFGMFNEDLIKSRIKDQKASFTGRATDFDVDCSKEKYNLVEATYNDETGDLDILSKETEIGCPGTNGYGSSEFGLIDSNGNLLLDQNFNSDLIYTDIRDPITGDLTGETYESDIPFILRLPDVYDASDVKIDARGVTKTIQLRSEEDNRLCLLS